MRIKIKLKLLFTLFLLAVTLNANDTLFLLPKESKNAQEHIETLIKTAQKSIDVAMYNFELKEFAKALVKAQKNGVEVNVFLDAQKIKDKASEYDYLRKNGVRVFIIGKEKLHTKLAIFDKHTAVFGSSNWTKESFDENYEIIYVSKQQEVLEKLNTMIKELKEK
ncbi:MAG: phospholipase D-like domain-containing protein [Arcobacteraceae bacterium]